MEIPSWAKEIPQGAGVKSRRRWNEFIEIGVFLMRERGLEQQDAREAVISNENIEEKDAVNFTQSFNRHLRIKRKNSPKYPLG